MVSVQFVENSFRIDFWQVHDKKKMQQREKGVKHWETMCTHNEKRPLTLLDSNA